MGAAQPDVSLVCLAKLRSKNWFSSVSMCKHAQVRTSEGEKGSKLAQKAVLQGRSCEFLPCFEGDECFSSCSHVLLTSCALSLGLLKQQPLCEFECVHAFERVCLRTPSSGPSPGALSELGDADELPRPCRTKPARPTLHSNRACAHSSQKCPSCPVATSAH